MTRLEALLARAAGQPVEGPVEARRDEPFYGYGPEDAPITIVMGAPSYDEYEARRPLLGRTGQKVVQHARLAGIDISRCRVEYVNPMADRPEYGESEECGVLEEATTACHGSLRAHRTSVGLPHVFIAMGDAALKALTGFSDSHKRRGSVYRWEGHRVLAMLDPRLCFGALKNVYEKLCRLDWERAKLMITPHTTHHQHCGCARAMSRKHCTSFGYKDSLALEWDITRYIAAAGDFRTVMAIDIETPKMGDARRIFCVSFSYKPEESLVLPFGDPYCRSMIKDICESHCIKVGHNFASFDRWWLKKEGVDIRGEIRDTLAMHHCLDPAARHSLEVLASRYTWEPFYKDENKGHDENVILKTPEAQKRYFDYGGLDSCVTRELHDILWGRLHERGMVDFYRAHYTDMFDPILDLSSRGVRIDQVARRALLASSLDAAREARDRLGVLNGAPLYIVGKNAKPETIAKKTVSSAQLKHLLYSKLAIPEVLKRRGSGEYTATTDATTLKKLKAEYGKTRPEVIEVIDLALAHNTSHKMASFCYDSHYSEDGRFRFTLKLNTEAARTASSAAPDGTGGNAQNLPRKGYRHVVLPEEGQIILDADLSQVESRFCFAYTGDPELHRLSRLRSNEFDQHKFVASLVFKKKIEDVLKDERQVCKSIGHGAQRAMQGDRMSDTLMNVGFVFTPDECDVFLEAYHKAFPGVRKWHQEVRKGLRANKRLVNSWGRVWDVRYEEANDELFRRGYSWLLQSECADLMNGCGFIPVWYWLKENRMKSRVMLHTHDGLVLSCPKEESYTVAKFLRDSLEVPRRYNGTELVVPLELAVGKNWGEKVEFSSLPDEATFMKVVEDL